MGNRKMQLTDSATANCYCTPSPLDKRPGKDWILGNVRNAEANRLVLLVRPTLGVVGRPAGQVLKQTDRANLSIRAQVEPVPGPSRHANQIARFDLDRDY